MLDYVNMISNSHCLSRSKKTCHLLALEHRHGFLKTITSVQSFVVLPVLHCPLLLCHLCCSHNTVEMGVCSNNTESFDVVILLLFKI